MGRLKRKKIIENLFVNLIVENIAKDNYDIYNPLNDLRKHTY